MSSILTNNSAMVALQTLKSVNSSLGGVQSEISTGLKIGSAKDNAAVFSISQVMKSDVTGFKAISESLSLGSSTVSVASNAADSVYDTLDKIKTKVISANEDNVDKATLQTEIESLVEQLTSTVGAAQFNGLNLLDGTNGGTVSFLSSLDRDAAGTLSTGKIDIDTTATNLSTTEGAAAVGLAGSSGTVAGGGTSFASVTASGGNSDIVISNVAADQTYEIKVGDESFRYTAKAGDTVTDVGNALGAAMTESETDLGITVDNVSTGGTINIVNNNRFARRLRSGRSIGASSGPSGSAAAGHAGPVDRQSGTAAASVAVPVITTMRGAVIPPPSLH